MIDGNGGVHISYDDMAANSWKSILMYATNVNGIWENKVVDGTLNVGQANDIAVDAGFKIHISYLNFGKMDLKYAVSS